MKESKAIKKWCPNVRHSDLNGGNCHTTSDGSDKSYSLCIGSDCMMWEVEMEEERKQISVDADLRTIAQAQEHVPDGWTYAGFVHVGSAASNGKALVKLSRLVETDRGDCGLKTKELYCEGCNQ